MSRGASERPSHDVHRQADGADRVELAARWYEAQGYEVLERDWRRREGDVDLIARRGATVVFSEVHPRPSDPTGPGADVVLPATQRRIHRLATRWLSELTPAVGRARIELRFDVVSISTGTVEVIQDAF